VNTPIDIGTSIHENKLSALVYRLKTVEFRKAITIIRHIRKAHTFFQFLGIEHHAGAWHQSTSELPVY
jgi:hypothetical protein